VQVSNLYELKFFNRVGKTDFSELYDDSYFRPQVEQEYAHNTKHRETFIEEIRRECDKSEWADVFIFVYPLYLSFYPGIMQSYFERIWANGFAFGPHGDHLKGKRFMLAYTTAGTKEYCERKVQIMHNIIRNRAESRQMVWVDPFPAFAVISISQEERKAYLEKFAERLKSLQ